MRYEDEIGQLQAAGVQAVYHVYREAGAGFASEICSQLEAGCAVKTELAES